MRYLDIKELKDKFGTLLSILGSNLNIELDIINEKVKISSYFERFETDEIFEFMDDSFEKIVSDILNYNGYIYYKENKIELFWAGIQYMNIFLNYQIPLKTIFLLMPLKEMVSKFKIYHEMNEKELCEEFINNYYSKSILKNLIDKEYSLRELSFLTDIPEASLKALEKNDNLFKTSNLNIEKLSCVLNVSKVYFRKKSNLVIHDYYLYKNKEFTAILTNNLKEFFNYKKSMKYINDAVEIKDDDEYLIISPTVDLEITDLRKKLNNHMVIISISKTCTVMRKIGSAVSLENVERQFKFIYKKSLDEFLKIKRDNLYF